MTVFENALSTHTGIALSVEELPTGCAIINNPRLNKGMAFTLEERDVLNLRGLLPPRIYAQDDQMQRILRRVRDLASPLDQFVYLMALHNRNETLFYRTIIENLEELMPIIYTPTVGYACQKYGHIFQDPQGIYLSAADKGDIKNLLQNWPIKDVRVIVVTDGERILGLGDLGAFGMGIPVGKLSLYTACAGVLPDHCLPVLLDVGTNNQKLLDDPFYTGLPQARLTGEAYDALVEEFIQAVQALYPHALVQFEDFANHNAFRMLEKYQDRICSFNDDIQGTGSVALAGLYAALRISRKSIAEQKVLFMGAGEAGMGIAHMICTAMIAEGMSETEALKRCWFVDSRGLVIAGRDGLNKHKALYAHEHPPAESFLQAVHDLKPTAIIGVSGQAGSFTSEVLEAMATYHERPVIFALSNPTSKAECTAEQAYKHTEGRAIFASGSPFAPVDYKGRQFVPGQGNNAYIFPGVGLGVIAAQSTRVTDQMFFIAAKTLSEQVSETDLEKGRIYPALSSIRAVSLQIAVAVAQLAYEQGLASAAKPDDLLADIQQRMYEPHYRSYV
ncbi:NAD-dependent malic enzyme [Candidatus Venteria ishoeyi]|uniref:NAD-dependent malic enzyme n=1 Tax=Candidatus Venteria ishoeyi TaxID=1899563 RepID=A0A1H6F3J3_9GAMM|nr:NAD-dependent malic enzyme [Candidatus Venteria ishoeyi]MDM8545207.1 NAD-dependent malic enzyme [Candidatus Venteria ishoeyi]SEH04690.1 NAD-dependent malic enzyme [Candidatus Venteria ishoeyi]